MTGVMTDKISETHELIASDKVEGTAVYSRSGDRLGTVNHFMVDKRTGHVAYAVMSFGGFLGMGNSYHPLPWKTLTYDPDLGGYLVDMTREQLQGGPAYTDATTPNWGDNMYGHQIDEYYDRPLDR
jgi:PRC-barrel domain